MNVYLPNLRLPSAYQEVEYIQSDGNQIIDTGVYCTGSTSILTKLVVSGRKGNYDMYYGAYGYGGVRAFFIQSNYPDNNKIRVVNYSNDGATRKYVDSINNLQYNTEYIIEHTNTKFIINGTLQGTMASSSFTTSYTLCLFGFHTKRGELEPRLIGKIYYFKIYDNGTLVRDFIPCYRKSDNIIGLYDLVNNQFYTNSGSGTFSKGNDVTMTVLKNDYIGEVYEYSYDFRNKTWSQCQTDGWTVTGGQTPSVGSDGIYYNGWFSNVVKTLDNDFSNANKITFSMYYYAQSNFDGLGFRILKMPGDGNRCGTWISKPKREVSIDNTIIKNISKYGLSAGWYNQTIEYDLVNKTYSYSGEFSDTGSLTDTQITTIRTLNTLGLGLDYAYVGTVSITVE